MNDASYRLGRVLDELGSALADFAKGLKDAKVRFHGAVRLQEGCLAWQKCETDGWMLVWETESSAGIRRTPIHKAPTHVRLEAAGRLEDLVAALSESIEQTIVDASIAAVSVRALTERLRNAAPDAT